MRRTLRVRPILLYCALSLLGGGVAWTVRANLDEQREHLLERQNNAMMWTSFITESSMLSVIDNLIFDGHRSLTRTLKPEDFAADAPTDDATERTPRREQIETVLKTLTKNRAYLVQSVSLLSLDGRVVAGDPMETGADELANLKHIQTMAPKQFLGWKLTRAPGDKGDLPCVRLWTPVRFATGNKAEGVAVYTLATRGFGNLEKTTSAKRGGTRMLSSTFRQSRARGLTSLDKDTRVLILDEEFRVIQTLSGDTFAADIPEPGAVFVSPQIRTAREQALGTGKPRVAFASPGSDHTPACHCLLDVSTHPLGYTILTQTVESSVLAPWLSARRSALYFGGLLIGGAALTLLLDLRRRRNRAEVAALNTELILRRAREEEMGKANAELERRVDERTSELAEANRELAAYAHTVSHDLRAPLRAVKNRVEMLMEDRPDLVTGDTGEHLRRIVANTGHMSRLIEDILTLSKISRLQPTRQTLDLAVMAREIADRLREIWPALNVSFVVPEHCMAQADAALMRIALENLLGNAWKYSSKTGDARVELGVRESADGRREYFVADNGAGFPAEQSPQLFKPFVRLHTHREFEGTGLGLATVARIIRLHGGDIRGEGAPGAGARFTFTLAGC